MNETGFLLKQGYAQSMEATLPLSFRPKGAALVIGHHSVKGSSDASEDSIVRNDTSCIRKTSTVILPLLIMFFSFGSCMASEFDPVSGKTLLMPDESFPKSVGKIWIRFFQKFISPYDGPKCGLRPTCSEYGRQAIGTYGFLKGWLMTSDRLQRCHPKKEAGFYRMQRGHIHDRPSENDLKKRERYDLFNSEWIDKGDS